LDDRIDPGSVTLRSQHVIRRFNRYELKYVIPVARSAAITQDLEGFAQLDAHGGSAGYRIVSLYYDSPDLDFFWAKVDGLRFRRKLRVRIYPGARIEDTKRAMVEIKQRTNRTVQKRRLELPLTTAEDLCLGAIGLQDLGSLDALDQEVASEVLYMVSAMHLRPSAITSYRRMAFVGGHYESGVRITFDTDLRGRTHALHVTQSAQDHSLLSPEWCVLEVKCDETVPDWVTSLLARHRCQLQRVSKYCATVAQLSGAYIPPPARAQVAISHARVAAADPLTKADAKPPAAVRLDEPSTAYPPTTRNATR
jgi:SPX domain protein involved in polyphosphate accumulation